MSGVFKLQDGWKDDAFINDYNQYQFVGGGSFGCVFRGPFDGQDAIIKVNMVESDPQDTKDNVLREARLGALVTEAHLEAGKDQWVQTIAWGESTPSSRGGGKLPLPLIQTLRVYAGRNPLTGEPLRNPEYENEDAQTCLDELGKNKGVFVLIQKVGGSQSLGGWLANLERQVLPADRIRKVLFQLLWGLYVANSTFGLVHADIKPANMVVTRVEQSQTIVYAIPTGVDNTVDYFQITYDPGDVFVRYIDVGGSCVHLPPLFSDMKLPSELDDVTEIVYTYGYIGPEVALKGGVKKTNVGTGNDLWAIGIIAYSMACQGRLAIQGDGFQNDPIFAIYTWDEFRDPPLLDGSFDESLPTFENVAAYKNKKDIWRRNATRMAMAAESVGNTVPDFKIGKSNVAFPRLDRNPLRNAKSVIQDSIGVHGLQLVQDLLQWNPADRLTFGVPGTVHGANTALFHPFFTVDGQYFKGEAQDALSFGYGVDRVLVAPQPHKPPLFAQEDAIGVTVRRIEDIVKSVATTERNVRRAQTMHDQSVQSAGNTLTKELAIQRDAENEVRLMQAEAQQKLQQEKEARERLGQTEQQLALEKQQAQNAQELAGQRALDAAQSAQNADQLQSAQELARQEPEQVILGEMVGDVEVLRTALANIIQVLDLPKRTRPAPIMMSTIMTTLLPDIRRSAVVLQRRVQSGDADIVAYYQGNRDIETWGIKDGFIKWTKTNAKDGMKGYTDDQIKTIAEQMGIPLTKPGRLYGVSDKTRTQLITDIVDALVAKDIVPAEGKGPSRTFGADTNAPITVEPGIGWQNSDFHPGTFLSEIARHAVILHGALATLTFGDANPLEYDVGPLLAKIDDIEPISFDTPAPEMAQVMTEYKAVLIPTVELTQGTQARQALQAEVDAMAATLAQESMAAQRQATQAANTAAKEAKDVVDATRAVDRAESIVAETSVEATAAVRQLQNEKRVVEQAKENVKEAAKDLIEKEYQAQTDGNAIASDTVTLVSEDAINVRDAIAGYLEFVKDPTLTNRKALLTDSILVYMINVHNAIPDTIFEQWETNGQFSAVLNKLGFISSDGSRVVGAEGNELIQMESGGNASYYDKGDMLRYVSALAIYAYATLMAIDPALVADDVTPDNITYTNLSATMDMLLALPTANLEASRQRALVSLDAAQRLVSKEGGQEVVRPSQVVEHKEDLDDALGPVPDNVAQVFEGIKNLGTLKKLLREPPYALPNEFLDSFSGTGAVQRLKDAAIKELQKVRGVAPTPTPTPPTQILPSTPPPPQQPQVTPEPEPEPEPVPTDGILQALEAILENGPNNNDTATLDSAWAWVIGGWNTFSDPEFERFWNLAGAPLGQWLYLDENNNETIAPIFPKDVPLEIAAIIVAKLLYAVLATVGTFQTPPDKDRLQELVAIREPDPSISFYRELAMEAKAAGMEFPAPPPTVSPTPPTPTLPPPPETSLVSLKDFQTIMQTGMKQFKDGKSNTQIVNGRGTLLGMLERNALPEQLALFQQVFKDGISNFLQLPITGPQPAISKKPAYLVQLAGLQLVQLTHAVYLLVIKPNDANAATLQAIKSNMEDAAAIDSSAKAKDSYGNKTKRQDATRAAQEAVLGLSGTALLGSNAATGEPTYNYSLSQVHDILEQIEHTGDFLSENEFDLDKINDELWDVIRQRLEFNQTRMTMYPEVGEVLKRMGIGAHVTEITPTHVAAISPNFTMTRYLHCLSIVAAMVDAVNRNQPVPTELIERCKAEWPTDISFKGMVRDI